MSDWTLLFILWAAWWWSGFALAVWGWATQFDELPVSVVVFAGLFTTMFGPLGGLMWFPSEYPLWKRKA